MLDSQKEVMVTGRVYGVARCTCEVRVYYGVHQVRPLVRPVVRPLGD